MVSDQEWLQKMVEPYLTQEEEKVEKNYLFLQKD